MSFKHFIIVSLCLLSITIHAKATTDTRNEPEPIENKEQEHEPKPEPEPEQVQLIKTSVSYVVVRLLVKPKLANNDFRGISMVYAMEKTNKKGEKEWIYSDKDGSISMAGIKNKIVASAVAGNFYQYDMEISNIEPASKIKLAFTAFYGNEKIKIALKEIEAKTKAKAPVTKILPQALTLQFENPNAVKYCAKVIKMKDGKETDCVFDVTMSTCFGNRLGLPELISGEKYTIKVWYIQADNTESEVTSQEIVAL